MIDEMVTLARGLGGLGEAETPLLTVLCAQTEAELLGRLRDGVGAQECAPALVLGGAWLALADLAMSDGVQSFSAGGLSMDLAPKERSAALRARAETVMSPYLKERGFCFAGVRG